MPVPCSFFTDKSLMIYLKYWIHSSFVLSQIRCMLLRSSATTVRTFQNTVINLTKTVFECRQVHFEALRRIVADASWVRKCALSVQEYAWPVTCVTQMKVHAQCSTVPQVHSQPWCGQSNPWKIIHKWKPPSLTITYPSSSGDSATIFEIFWYNANNIPFPPANSVKVKLSCNQFFF